MATQPAIQMMKSTFVDDAGRDGSRVGVEEIGCCVNGNAATAIARGCTHVTSIARMKVTSSGIASAASSPATNAACRVAADARLATIANAIAIASATVAFTTTTSVI